jgi:hypothetical protein
MTATEDCAAPPHQCSFCDKDEASVRRLIAGHSAFICDECVDLCREVVAPSAPDGEVLNGLVRVWAEMTLRRKWTAAMLTGVLAQLVDLAEPEPRAWSWGEKMTSHALNQVDPANRRREKPLRCDYCAKGPDETLTLNAGHGGQICGECVETLLEVRASFDPAYRDRMIERLTALPDEPPPPVTLEGLKDGKGIT